MRTNKRRRPSYSLRVMLFFIIALLSAIIVWQFLSLQFKYKQGQEDISEIKSALSALEEYANSQKPFEEGSPQLQIDIIYPSLSRDNPDNLSETVTYVQNANAQALGTINNYLIVFSIIITIVVLIVPIFNYWFLQKDQIKRLDDQFNDELDRMRKSIKQSIQVSYNVISGVVNDKTKVTYQLISPISESPKDKATALSLNTDIFMLRNQPLCALQNINRAIDLEPDNAEYHNDRGVIFSVIGREEEAIKNFNKAIILDSNNVGFYLNRGSALSETGRYKEALSDFDTALRLDSENSLVHYARGATFNDMGKYKLALKDLDIAIELEPDNANFIFCKGITLNNQELFEDALKSKSEAIELDRDNAEYYISRGATLYELDRFEEALKDYNKAIELKSGNVEYHIIRGKALNELERFEEALLDYNKVIELRAGCSEFYSDRAEILFALKRYESALQDNNQLIKLDSRNAEYFEIRALTLWRLKRYKAAQADLETAIELDSNNEEYIADLAYCLYKVSRFDDAMAFCSKLNENINSSFIALRARALTSLMQILAGGGLIGEEQRNQALNDIERALEIDQDNRFSCIDQAQAFYLLHEHASMLESLKRAKAIDSDEPETYHWLAEYFRAIGDKDNAALNDRIAREKGYIPEPEE